MPAARHKLIARVTYDAFDDYTLAHITGDNGVEVYADVLFDATVAPFDSSVTSEMQNALAEKYQGLLRDFVDKTKPVDRTAVSDDRSADAQTRSSGESGHHDRQL